MAGVDVRHKPGHDDFLGRHAFRRALGRRRRLDVLLDPAQRGEMLKARALPVAGYPARRMPVPRAGWAVFGSSSNSSASFSIIVPPSCSASTMVTARR